MFAMLSTHFYLSFEITFKMSCKCGFDCTREAPFNVGSAWLAWLGG